MIKCLFILRMFDDVMSCFSDSPPQSPIFPEAGHPSLYDEDDNKVHTLN